MAVGPLGSDALLFDRNYGPSNYQTAGESAVTEVFPADRRGSAQAFGARTWSDCAALAAGLAGVDRPRDAAVYRRMLQNAGFSGPLAVYNDMDTVSGGRHAGRTVFISTAVPAPLPWGERAAERSGQAAGAPFW